MEKAFEKRKLESESERKLGEYFIDYSLQQLQLLQQLQRRQQRHGVERAFPLKFLPLGSNSSSLLAPSILHPGCSNSSSSSSSLQLSFPLILLLLLLHNFLSPDQDSL